MNEPVEILLTSESNGTLWSCCAWDSRTGTNLMTYKGGGSVNNHGLCLIKNEFIITSNFSKPLLHIWPINNQDQVSDLRYVVPGKVNALAISPDGNYLVAGIQDTIYIWQICSGKMLNCLSKHYQSISVIKFTSDGSHFISGGKDGFVLVWNLTKVVSSTIKNSSSTSQSSSQQIQPLYTFNDHALPVTDIHIGYGGIRAYMCTTSLDRTCLIYDLSSNTLLLNLVFDEPLTCVVINSIETFVYVGTINGTIYEFSLISAPRTKEYHLTDKDYTNKFVGHKSKITCLSLSSDGETLISGSTDENVHIWNIKSRQLLRTISHKGEITNIELILTTKNIMNPENKFNLITNNLKRMMESSNSSEDSNHVVEIMVSNSTMEDDDDDEYVHNLSIKSDSCVVSRSCETSSVSVDDTKKIEKLKQDVNNLRKYNKELYKYAVERIFNE